MPDIFYLCDGNVCPYCPHDLCKHTSDINYAKNDPHFASFWIFPHRDDENDLAYFEIEED